MQKSKQNVHDQSTQTSKRVKLIINSAKTALYFQTRLVADHYLNKFFSCEMKCLKI